MSERSLIYYTDFLACVKENLGESRNSAGNLRLRCLVARYLRCCKHLTSVQEIGYNCDDYAPVSLCSSWCVMESEPRATILDKLAKQYRIRVFNPARWEEIELQHVLEGVESLATLMGGDSRFQSEMRALKQTVHISRVSWRTSAAAVALPGVDVIYFKLASWNNPPELKWQTVHEMAHTWDMRRLLALSRGLRRATDSRYGRPRWQPPIFFEYKPGGRWLKDRKPPIRWPRMCIMTTRASGSE
jgi:hypothetical protein